ncbi:hypothetical protein ES705_34880 [subsurface metagenome]
MRVILTQHLTNNAGALLMRARMVNPHIIHSIKDAPVYRFQSVPHIRQGTGSDNTHSIGKIRALHLIFNIYRFDFS